jgi:hypothetical protein
VRTSASISAQVGATRPGTSRLRVSTRRRCSSLSEQTISTSIAATGTAAATARQPLRAAATGLTQSAITVRPSRRLSAATAWATR